MEHTKSINMSFGVEFKIREEIVKRLNKRGIFPIVSSSPDPEINIITVVQQLTKKQYRYLKLVKRDFEYLETKNKYMGYN